ncbi:hypothetical protein HED60_19480 [Planctomycetales bacterium ZRK34]|nr:hypothetical protein HED60_19480 [Planctomycetales bacterium ZRK34]
MANGKLNRRRRVGKRSLSDAPTWHYGSRSWRKRATINGKQIAKYYRQPHTAVGKAKAAEDWAADLASIRHEQQQLERMQMAAELRSSTSPDDHPQQTAQALRTADDIEGGMGSEVVAERRLMRNAAAIAIRAGDYQRAAEIATSLAEATPAASKAQPKPESLDDILNAYAEACERRHQLGELGATRLANIKRWVNRMKKDDYGHYSKPTTEAEYAEMLSQYRAHHEQRVIDKTIKRSTFDDRMRDMSAFSRWASESYRLPRLPRNIGKALRKYNDTGEGGKAIDDQALAKLWGKADSLGKCCIALALNCGMYSVDIASIRPDDIKGDKIHFVRGKTGVKVTYKLWPITQRLLKKHLKSDGITMPNGKPLYETHKSGRTDRLYRDIWRPLRDKLNLDGITFNNFRDTGSTLVEGIDRAWTDTYLAHADRRMAQRYSDGNHVDYDAMYKDFHKATDKMYADHLKGIIK